MAKEFCLKCDFGTNYEFSKPKFCAQCGSPFGSVAVNVKASTPEPAPQRQPPASRPLPPRKPKFFQKEDEERSESFAGDNGEDEFDDDFDSSNFSVPSNLNYKIVGRPQGGDKLGSLLNSPSNENFASAKPKMTKAQEKKHRQSVIQEFQREATSVRSKNKK